MLPVVAAHQLAIVDPAGARLLSEVLMAAVQPTTLRTYRCGFNSLLSFCDARGLRAIPVDAITLCAWLTSLKCRHLKPKSVSKYLAGVRHFHLLQGSPWLLKSDPLVTMTLNALRSLNPTSDLRLKVPLTFDLLLRLCRLLPGWPVPHRMDFDDLVWAAASAVAFFAALRGGEFSTYAGSSRPVLRTSHVDIVDAAPARFVRVRIVGPKGRPGVGFAAVFAASPPASASGGFDPVKLLAGHWEERVPVVPTTSSDPPAFQLRDGSAVTRDFMVRRTSHLLKREGIRFFTPEGDEITPGAASWRTGYVSSAMAANVPDSTIRTQARWASLDSQRPYTFVTPAEISRGSASIVIHAAAAIDGSITGGRFASSTVLEHSAHR